MIALIAGTVLIVLGICWSAIIWGSQMGPGNPPPFWSEVAWPASWGLIVVAIGAALIAWG